VTFRNSQNPKGGKEEEASKRVRKEKDRLIISQRSVPRENSWRKKRRSWLGVGSGDVQCTGQKEGGRVEKVGKFNRGKKISRGKYSPEKKGHH